MRYPWHRCDIQFATSTSLRDSSGVVLLDSSSSTDQAPRLDCLVALLLHDKLLLELLSCYCRSTSTLGPAKYYCPTSYLPRSYFAKTSVQSKSLELLHGHRVLRSYPVGLSPPHAWFLAEIPEHCYRVRAPLRIPSCAMPHLRLHGVLKLRFAVSRIAGRCHCCMPYACWCPRSRGLLPEWLFEDRRVCHAV